MVLFDGWRCRRAQVVERDLVRGASWLLTTMVTKRRPRAWLSRVTDMYFISVCQDHSTTLPVINLAKVRIDPNYYVKYHSLDVVTIARPEQLTG
jgi:hypothetical protein